MENKYLVSLFCFVTCSAVAGWEEDAERNILAATDGMYASEDLAVVVKCDLDGLNVLLGFEYLIGDSDSDILVQLIVDKNEAYGPHYWPLQDNQVSWMPLGHVRGMVQQMEAGNSLAIEVTDPADGEQLSQRVSLKGFGAAVQKLNCYRTDEVSSSWPDEIIDTYVQGCRYSILSEAYADYLRRQGMSEAEVAAQPFESLTPEQQQMTEQGFGQFLTTCDCVADVIKTELPYEEFEQNPDALMIKSQEAVDSGRCEPSMQ